jgi:hypothetical protein
MSVLNTASDGYFNVLIVLYRAIAAYGKIPRERLLSLCSAGTDPARLRQTLNRWTELGLFIEDGGQIVFAPDTDSIVKGKNGSSGAMATLPALVRRIIFRDENNERFWDTTGSRCADLTRGLAWLLAQNIYGIDLGSHSGVERLETQQITDRKQWIVQNDVRWSGLLSWGRYLGFLWYSEKSMIDPTTAIREDLPLIFGTDRELTASVFIDRIAAALPVLDHGRYRVEVEKFLNSAHWQGVSRPEVLSTALSRALWRMDAARVLVLDTRADAKDSRVLQRSGEKEWRRFTHVRLEGAIA